jgi:adenosylcobinamide-phosphate synthase
MPWVRLIVAVFLLKSTFSVRGLIQAAAQVQSALSADDLAEARRLVSWHLVSRDVRSLNREQVAAAAVESVAENLGDGIIAPFFYYTLFGLPGALVHRAVNTCDALYGYHGRYEWVGKVPAHLDDILNFIPARLGALFLLLAGGIGRGNVRQGWRIMWRDHGKTESPNAGWPMSIAAGLLGVELEKVGYYRLGAPASFPDASTIGRIRHLVLIAALCAALVVSVLLVARTYGYRAP